MAIFYPPTPSGVGELIWDSLKKRKREWTMAKNYYRNNKRRRLVTYKGRRKFKRRRMPMSYKSNHGLGTSGSYYVNRRKRSMRQYRRRLLLATNEARHYRAVSTITGIVNTPASFFQKKWQSIAWVPQNFTDVGVTNYDDSLNNVVFDKMVTIRGGLVQMTFKNQGTDPIRVECFNVWMVAHAENTYIPEYAESNTNSVTNVADDPTTFGDRNSAGQANGREYKILRRRQALIEGGGVWTILDKLQPARVALEDFNTDTFKHDRKMYYWFCVDSPGENTSARMDWTRATNMSYSGDVIDRT